MSQYNLYHHNGNNNVSLECHVMCLAGAERESCAPLAEALPQLHMHIDEPRRHERSRSLNVSWEL